MRAESAIDIGNDKIAVFKSEQCADIKDQRADHTDLRNMLSAISFNKTPVTIIDQRSKQEQGNPDRLSPGVKDEGEDGENEISPCAVFRDIV